MTTRILHTIENITGPPQCTLLFALLRHDSSHKSSPINILHSFLYQLVDRNRTLLPILLDAYIKHTRKLRSDIQYITTLLQKLVDSIGLTYIVVDGLDECDEVHRSLLLRSLLEISQKCTNMRLAISSRNELDILQALKSVSISFNVEKDNKMDIQAYVSGRLSDLSREILKHSPVDNVERQIDALLEPITTKAEG